MHLVVFDDVGVVDEIARIQVALLDGVGIAERERPVSKGTADGFPDAGEG